MTLISNRNGISQVDEKKIKKKRNGLVGTDTDTLYFVSESDKVRVVRLVALWLHNKCSQ